MSPANWIEEAEALGRRLFMFINSQPLNFISSLHGRRCIITLSVGWSVCYIFVVISRIAQVWFSWNLYSTFIHRVYGRQKTNLTQMFSNAKAGHCQLLRGQGQSSRSKLSHWYSDRPTSKIVIARRRGLSSRYLLHIWLPEVNWWLLVLLVDPYKLACRCRRNPLAPTPLCATWWYAGRSRLVCSSALTWSSRIIHY